MTQGNSQPYQLFDVQDQKMQQPLSSRAQFISPWIENITFPRSNSKLYAASPHKNNNWNEDINVENKRRVEFMSTLHQKVQVKRKRFRTIIQKMQNAGSDKADKQIMFQNNLNDQIKNGLHYTPNKSNMFEKYNASKQLSQNQAILNRGKKVLSTTMYVYQCEQPRKLTRRNRSARGLNFGYEAPMASLKLCHSTEKSQMQPTYGSKNLQRILKMKQKIRIKNSCLVKKVKQTSIQSDKDLTFKQKLMQTLPSKNWKSITLDAMRSNPKLQKTTQQYKIKPSSIALRHEFELRRNVTADFFS